MRSVHEQWLVQAGLVVLNVVCDDVDFQSLLVQSSLLVDSGHYPLGTMTMTLEVSSFCLVLREAWERLNRFYQPLEPML